MGWERTKDGTNYVSVTCECGFTSVKIFKSNTDYGVGQGQCTRCGKPLTFIYG